MMKGFDPEFQNLDHYIRVITDRIWEGRRLDDIRRYYGENCAVETPSSVSIGIEPVIDGTRATLAAFPDRRLLAEDVLSSGDDQGGFLSSHRIASPMTHAGPGAFGPASGRPLFVRTIADCVCIDNRIVHEWLVRDQAAIARQIGRHERELAAAWLAQRGGWHKPPMPPAPPPYVSFIDTHPLAQRYASLLHAQWLETESTAEQALRERADAGVISALPAGEAAVGVPALRLFWSGMAQALRAQSFSVEHLTLNQRPGRADAIALRWRVQAVHGGPGRYGAPSGAAVEVLGISHAELEGGHIVREWHLIDDVALWMQVLAAQAQPQARPD
jgi:predicted ester cyclase